MSASSAGPRSPRPAYGSEAAAPLHYSGAQLRSSDPLAQLSRRLNSACVRAVHPHELAAILEAEGFTDALVQERFGDPNVFECAERLFRLVPYRPAQQVWLLPQAGRPLWRDLMRGLIYLLPAAWSPAALQLGGQLGWGEGASLGLLLASLFGWGWMQSVAYLGYFSLVAGQYQARAMLRRAGSAAVLLSGLLAAAVAAATGQNVFAVTLVATAIATYLAAATALLVLEHETWLVLGLLPALLLTLLGTLSPDWSSGQAVGDSGAALQAVSVLLLAVGVPLLAAWIATRPPPLASPASDFGQTAGGPSLRQVATSLPYGVYGWLCAAFLSLTLLSAGPISGPSQASGAGLLGWSWSVAPLVLSMGVLERTLRRIQQALRAQASSSASLSSIVWSGFARVLNWGAGYLCVLLLGYLLLGALVPDAALPGELVVGHLALAAALLLSGLLINFGLLPRVLLVWGLGLFSQLGLRALGVEVSSSYALSAALCAGLLVLGTWAALRDLRHFQ